MPRRRRHGKARRGDDGFTAAVASLLVHGWGSPLLQLGEDWADVFLLTEAQLVDLWRVHRVELETEAAAAGITAWGAQLEADITRRDKSHASAIVISAPLPINSHPIRVS